MSSEIEPLPIQSAPSVEPEPRSTTFRFLNRLRERKAAVRGFHFGWMQALVTLSFFGLGALALPSAGPNEFLVAQIAGAAAAGTMCFYFAHLLLLRLQLSLIEGCTLMAMLGNALGLLLTMPGIRSVGLFWLSLLVPMTIAWILYGSVKGLIQAELLEISAPFKRAMLMVCGTISVAAPALLLSGAALWLGRGETRIVSRNMLAWALPLMIIGAAGFALRVWLGLKARRAAIAALRT